MPIDIISLSYVDDAPIAIPSELALVGESDNALLLFSCLKLGVKSMSECIIPGPSYPEENPSFRSDGMRLSYIVLKLVSRLNLVAFLLGLCSTSSYFCPA